MSNRKKVDEHGETFGKNEQKKLKKIPKKVRKLVKNKAIEKKKENKSPEFYQ